MVIKNNDLLTNPSELTEEMGFVPGELIVKLKTEITAAEINVLQEEMDLDVSVIKTTQTLGIQLWEINGTSVEEAIEILSEDPRFEYVERNFTGSYTETIPNDLRFDELWGLNNTGQTGGASNADIDAPEAWDLQTGTNVMIGLLDSGVDYTHPDLAANIWTNPGEIAGNGIDDDGNGFVDDIHGYDFGNDDPDPEDNLPHGTHVAGTIAAVGNNNIGVTGVNWDAQIMVLKIGDFFPETFAAIQALEYGVLMGAQLTNNSWTVPDSRALRDAIEAAGEEEQLFIAAAGNGSNNNDIFPSYPASYDLDNIIAVAATDDNDLLAGFSNFGATSVDLGAPGVDILSTVLGNDYDFLSGTSMATPHVVGVASLILSEDPGLSAEEVKKLILDTTDPITSLDGITVSGGRLNAFNALSELEPPLELIGTDGDDVLVGTNRRDIISGLGGNDIIEGLAGNDELSGGNGNDLINAGNGNDSVTGDAGHDDILGGSGDDLLDGGGGADRILGEAGDDAIEGGGGNDTILSGDGNDTASGGSGRDRVFGGDGEDTLNGNSGADALTGGFGNDTLDGGAGRDNLNGVEPTRPGADVGFGAGEVDTLTGGANSDTFVLGEETRVYYDDGDPLTRGDADFALITDFNARQDSIQLNGSAEFYILDFFTSTSGTTDAVLFFDPGVSARREVIGTLQDISPELSLTDSPFHFVGRLTSTLPDTSSEPNLTNSISAVERLTTINPSNQGTNDPVEKSRTPVIVAPPSDILTIDEPNDTIPEAVDTGLDSSGTFTDSGFIGDNPSVVPTNEVDLLKFQLDAGDRVTIDIDAQVLGSPLDSRLRLFDSAGNEVAANDDSDGLDSFIDFTASVSDTYYAGVSSYDNFGYDPFVEGSGFDGFSAGEYDIEIFVEENPFALTNGSLLADIREDNGAIDTIFFGGSDFFNPGGPVSNFGFQNGADTFTFVANDTSGFGPQPVTVERIGDAVVVTGTYTGGGANVDFTRTYSLVDDFNVVSIETEFVNNGSDLTLSYFDTFDPDQGVDQGNSFETFNDVLTLDTGFGEATVGQATELDGLTFIAGSLNSDITVASGSPFGIFDGFTLNDFFASPFDGDGALDDQGTHIGIQLDLDAGETDSFEYFQAYGVSIEDAQEQFIQAVAPPTEIIGTEGNDFLRGTNGRDNILGLGGDDTIQALSGNDLVSGGRGDDLIDAGDGNDTVTGDAGRDDILGGNGNDLLYGDGGGDLILGGDGDDTVEGGHGNDTVDGGEGNDSVSGGGGRDFIFGGAGEDNLTGGADRDTLTGEFGNDVLDGGRGNDTLIGVDPTSLGAEVGFGAGEVDILTGREGRDIFVLGDEDRVYYDDGDPLTFGEADFALITDFNVRRDFIQLNGSADLYSLDFFTSGAGTIDADLIFDPGASARGEVIATLQDVSPELSLTDDAFLFV